MRSVKPLTEAVRSSVRSGIVVSDLTRIVEELIFNSLDAGASKVSVYIGVQSCYVKVVDDGFGIPRDGLVLVGERYASSSKLHQLTDLDAASRSFGYRGEALASISDVSLLEIITKAHGKPNGYHKVIKGCKCLFLGIDDDRKEVGTTVVLRDLFYNQPVRRKLMQSSPNKALSSVKKSVFRIALVHTNISFKVVDIESEEEYLNMRSSSSPLPLLMSGFGIHDFSSLHQLNATEGPLKLSGYISGPSDNFAFKAFQYVYINSRSVYKGPIHKLLNNMACSFELSDPWKIEIMSQKGKRNRPREYPAYILNICCPPTFYDLTFEPSKTYVEFKEWKPILIFVNNAVQSIWKKVRSHELISPAHGLGTLGRDESWKEDIVGGWLKEKPGFEMKRCKNQNHQESFYPLSCQLSKPGKEGHLESWNGCRSPRAQKIHIDKWASDFSVLREDEPFLDDAYPCSGRSIANVMGNWSDSKLDDDCLAIEDVLTNQLGGNGYPIGHHDVSNEPLLRNAGLSPGFFSQTRALDEPLFVGGRLIQSPTHVAEKKRKRFSVLSNLSDVRIDQSDGSFSLTTAQDDVMSLQNNCTLKKKDKMPRCLDDLAEASTRAYAAQLDDYGENSFLADSTSLVENSVIDHQSLNTEWYSGSSEPLFQATNWKENSAHVSIRNLEENFISGEKAVCRNVVDDKDFPFELDLTSHCYDRKDTPFDSRNISRGYMDGAGYIKDSCRFSKYSFVDNFPVEYSGILGWERECSGSDWRQECQRNTDSNEVQKHPCVGQDDKYRPVLKGRYRRSRSAPPFCKEKKRGISRNGFVFKKAVRFELDKVDSAFTSSETTKLNNHQQSPNQYRPVSDGNRQNINEPDLWKMKKKESFGVSEEPQWLEAGESGSIEEHMPEANKDFEGSLDKIKWRSGYALGEHVSYDIRTQDDILDISSEFLHHASNSLVPVAINKDSLQDAKVLAQVDKKFIPIVAGGTLALIDQHAADERIRLEELRSKILSGDAKTITYLDVEQALRLPEIGYQLLQNYAEHVKEWGWICNIHSKDLKSFKQSLSTLQRQQTSVTLLAVPCILGVSLSDKDLLEFLEQLSETDGSSRMPPSVLRVLNSKACRGAIMFGDSLLHSECSLIFEELKKTSLCFQCAHGRPTMAPIVKLEALHKQISKLEALADSSNDTWHGLRRHTPTLEHATLHLAGARG